MVGGREVSGPTVRIVSIPTKIHHAGLDSGQISGRRARFRAILVDFGGPARAPCTSPWEGRQHVGTVHGWEVRRRRRRGGGAARAVTAPVDASPRERGGQRGVRWRLVRRVRRWTAQCAWCAATRIQEDTGEKKNKKTTGNIWFYGKILRGLFRRSMHGITKPYNAFTVPRFKGSTRYALNKCVANWILKNT